MNIKILSSLTNVTKERNDVLTIGTHSGIFHADEVVACAILCLTTSNSSVQILRSCDSEMLSTVIYVLILVEVSLILTKKVSIKNVQMAQNMQVLD